MEKLNIKYCIPSYHRADTIKTINYVPCAKVYVSPEDYEDYIKFNPKFKENIIKCPEGIQGTPDGKGKIKTMNWILDTEMKDDNTCIIFLDDDITCLMKTMRKEKDIPISTEEFLEMNENYCILAREWGIGIWSYNTNADPLSYKEYLPFSVHAYLDGSHLAFVKKNELRFDERFTVKEDVDMVLQQIQKYHKVLRVNRYYYKVKGFEGKGGVQEFRTVEKEKEQFKMFRKKWGDVVIQNKPRGKKASKMRGYNGAVRINIPIDGN